MLQSSGENGPKPDLSCIERLERGPTKGIQIYQEDTENASACWKALPAHSAELQCSGEAQYVDDLPTYTGAHLLYMSSSLTHLLYMS